MFVYCQVQEPDLLVQCYNWKTFLGMHTNVSCAFSVPGDITGKLNFPKFSLPT